MAVKQYERRLDNVKNFKACAGEKRIIMNDRDWEYKLKRSNNSGNNLLCLPHIHPAHLGTDFTLAKILLTCILDALVLDSTPAINN